MTRDVVRAGYDEIGEKYHSWSHASAVRLGFVQQVLDRLPAGGTVVDLSAGAPATQRPGCSASSTTWSGWTSRPGSCASPSDSHRAPRWSRQLVELALQPSSVDAVLSFYALGIGRDATLAAVEAAGMTVEDAQVVGEDEGEDRIVAFLWVTAVKRG